MGHALVKAGTVTEVITMIAASYRISEENAMENFYSSATGQSYADDDTGLYAQSALYVFSLYQDEVNNKI